MSETTFIVSLRSSNKIYLSTENGTIVIYWVTQRRRAARGSGGDDCVRALPPVPRPAPVLPSLEGGRGQAPSCGTTGLGESGQPGARAGAEPAPGTSLRAFGPCPEGAKGLVTAWRLPDFQPRGSMSPSRRAQGWTRRGHAACQDQGHLHREWHRPAGPWRTRRSSLGGRGHSGKREEHAQSWGGRATTLERSTGAGGWTSTLLGCDGRRREVEAGPTRQLAGPLAPKGGVASVPGPGDVRSGPAGAGVYEGTERVKATRAVDPTLPGGRWTRPGAAEDV